MWNSIVSVPNHCLFIYFTLAYQHYASGINGTGLKFSTRVDTRSNEICVDFIFSKCVTFCQLRNIIYLCQSQLGSASSAMVCSTIDK